MKFIEFEHIVSPARANKYLYACSGNQRKCMLLYKYNIQLCQRFFGVLNMFEVMLRNTISDHYSAFFSDRDWIIHQAAQGKLLENNIAEVSKKEMEFRQSRIYSSDRMVSAFTFGFWTYMFSRNKYNLGGKTLLKIFPARSHGTTQKSVYSDLTRIREFRNRLAHHEPILFDRSGRVNIAYTESMYDTIRQYVTFMDYRTNDVFSFTERPDAIMSAIQKIF